MSALHKFDSGGSSILPILVILSFLLPLGSSYLVDSNPYRHVETLDPEGKYILEWMVDWDSKRVIFNVTCETNGYIGFGLSRRGKMTGADLIIGGVAPDGKPYFTDRNAIGNQMPVVDQHQDWDLHAAFESGPHTFLSFSRAFETCDKEDYPITEDVISIIWSYGENDNTEEYHFHNRGHFDAFLLDPDLVPRVAQPQYRTKNPKELGDLKVWSINKMEVLPPKETYYTCTFHKAPRFKDKQHIVGFNTALLTGLERRFVLKFILYRCHPPKGRDAAAFFERYTRNRGDQCYTHKTPKGKVPTLNCQEPVHIWAMNGKPVFLPEHVGIPMSESPNEYYMLQTHYENPMLTQGIRLRFTLEVFYTDNLRKHDAGVMIVGHKKPGSPSLIIPPSSLSHSIYGHCGGKCTKEMMEGSAPQGIQVFAASLHTNMAGRQVRMIHVREEEELPWITYDDNYNFMFQQTRILRKERNILPGDQLITKCIYDTAGKPYSVVGGVSLRNEQCMGVIWYYNRLEGYGICDSEIRSETYLGRLGIMNATWSDLHLEMVVNSPQAVSGLTVTDVCTRHIKWTIARRNQLQDDHRYLPQINECPILIPGMEKKAGSKGSSSSSYKQDSSEESPHLTRYVPGGASKKKEKEEDGNGKEKTTEYISIYGKDVVPYERPPRCVEPHQGRPQSRYEGPGGEMMNEYDLDSFPKAGTWWSINTNAQGFNTE